MMSGRGRRNERRNKLKKGRGGERGQGSRKKLRRKCEISSIDCHAGERLESVAGVVRKLRRIQGRW